MPTASATIAFLLATAVFVVVPGPSVFFIIGRAIALGRRAALATAAGNLVGVLVIVVAVSLGIGALVERLAIALVVLKFAGAAYLVWLGVRAWRHRGRTPGLTEGAVEPVDHHAFREGVIVGLTNPKALVFFAAVLPQFVDPGQAGPTTQMLALGLLFCALASGMDAAWAFGAGTARAWFARSPRRLRTMGGAGGLIMIGMGVGVAATGRQP
ncbi:MULTISPECIES: LysE family translocator [unclassified Pseudonocardia]|uniref:LysE family translocator n=1 Tax=unclassified Pseudonocardia TaxID=2619320 RepID=UPI0001FFF381|nr:LysE family translocator [Pseudonocardia sp. Ae707_Ps1]OLM20922.1 putative threonine efflux protein [Pseudonocardia sp. Ae707_Ps1]